MIIKLSKVISCSSEHPSYPASNLLVYHSNKSWRCAKPGEMLATVIFQMAESSCIIGLDIGNYRSCVVIVDASTDAEPDKWVPIVNHQFLTNDEAANSKFRDQVQIFTKKELNPDTLNVKFDRLKVTCMQSANPRELFGLIFITFKTEVKIDLRLDVFGRFKLKDSSEFNVDEFKEKYLKLKGSNQSNQNGNNYKQDLKAKIKEASLQTFTKRQEEPRDSPKRPLLQKLEEGKADEVFDKKDPTVESNEKHSKVNKKDEKVLFTPFGDVLPAKPSAKELKTKVDFNTSTHKEDKNKVSKKHELDNNTAGHSSKKLKCSDCSSECTEDKLCNDCGQLVIEKEKKNDKTNISVKKKTTKPFRELFIGETFALSGYVNPQRDLIRSKAIQMGAKYVVNPDATNNRCTYLLCAFKNTPKYQQLKNSCKIVSHTFIEECFDKKTRFPWRRYALDTHCKNQPESEEEIEAMSNTPYDMDTDDSDY